MQDFIEEKVKDLLAKVEKADWETMKNDIERYQKIKELIINAFTSILELSPQPIRVIIQSKIKKIEESDPIFEFEELESFLKLVHILTTGLLSSLDEKDIKDYAAPHQAVGYLDRLVRINENKEYSENNVVSLGAAFTVELKGLIIRLEKIDWKKGWKDD